MCELEIFKQVRGEYPILILDDLFSELDREKINNILKDILNNPDENSVTRTKIMLMYCCAFVYENSDDEYTEIFEDFAGEYIDGLNEYLYESSYQRFSRKNLLDVMLLYMAFVMLRA